VVGHSLACKETVTISQLLNNPKNDRPELLQPTSPIDPPTP
jgi:hypothetical protein